MSIDECRCKNVGEDDGDTTCWVHHDCNDGTCTHQDGDDFDEPSLEELAMDREMQDWRYGLNDY